MNKKPKASYPFFDETNPTMRLDLFTWPEVDEYLRHCKGIILPIGSTEQHGPTGAIGTDALTAQAVAHEVSKRTGVLVTPTQPYGMAEHHLGFAGTMSLRPETLLELVHDLLISLFISRTELSKTMNTTSQKIIFRNAQSYFVICHPEGRPSARIYRTLKHLY